MLHCISKENQSTIYHFRCSFGDLSFGDLDLDLLGLRYFLGLGDRLDERRGGVFEGLLRLGDLEREGLRLDLLLGDLLLLRLLEYLPLERLPPPL